MTEYSGQDDVTKLGFKCGLEIHHQIKTDKKLFCRCPAVLRTDKPHTQITRHMRPTMSELGVYDGTALMEFKTKKNITYQIFRDTVCTYEFDDTPPFPVNQDAVDIGIHIAMILNCSIVDELHVSRKQYLDGSIPTGFQRTMIIGVNGWVPFKERKIGIIQLGLEEDACRQMKNWGHEITFKTDRLSIPLVEVVTLPDIRTPEEVPEVAGMLGRMLRSTQRVRRGDGSVRQDINVSITGGTRVEIKGVPKLSWMAAITRIEALRQKSLLDIRDELARRGVNKETFKAEISDLTQIFKNTACEFIRKTIDAGGEVLGVRLDRFRDILTVKTQPGKTFADEIAGRLHVIACVEYDPVNLIHTGQMPVHGVTQDEKSAVLNAQNAGPDDVVVVVWGNPTDATTAAQEVRIRAHEATIGIPNETRQPFEDGTTDFERILPGPDRMYPDTDSPPNVITKERLGTISKQIGEPPLSREARYAKMGIPKHIALELAISPRAPLFDTLVEKLSVAPVFAATTLISTIKSLVRACKPVDQLTDEQILDTFKAHRDGRIAREGVEMVLSRLSQKGGAVLQWVEELSDGKPDEETLKGLVHRAAEGVAKMPKDMDPVPKAMGLLMANLRGKVPGAQVAGMLKEELGR